MNEILRRAFAEAGVREQDVAARLGVDTKTVRRWLEGRRPYPRHRTALANLLGIDQRTVWRNEVPSPRQSQYGGADLEAS